MDNHTLTALEQQVATTTHLSEATRQVYLERIKTPKKENPDFFSQDVFRLLISVSNRLIPQDSSGETVDLAGLLDSSFLAGEGDGWRYDEMPEDNTAVIKGLENIEKSSLQKFNKSFNGITGDEQDKLLSDIQSGCIEWQELNGRRFFEELLARLTEIYYSHPLTRMSINDQSGFDLPGWTNIGLDQTEQGKR